VRPVREGRLGLAPFLAELEARLLALSPDELRARLLADAERLPPGERTAFLALFGDEQPAERALEGKEALLADIAGFVEDLRSGAYVEGWGWDPDLHEERAFGDESWVGELDALFHAAGDAFLADGLELAREAYGRLLRALLLEGDGLFFCGPEPAEEMLDTDVAEAKARYLRAVYETTPLAERAARLAEEVAALGYVGGGVRLRRLAEARRGDLPDLEAFLPGWIELLRGAEGLGPEERELLIEAVALKRGSDGLGELARERREPELFLAWIDALLAEDRLEDAAAACREALERLESLGEGRARIAEHLARIAARQGDAPGRLEGRRAAWRASPSTERLLELVESAAALGLVEEVLAAESDRIEEGAACDARQACGLLLLARRVEPALTLLETAAPLGWSDRRHPGPVVVPYLLLAGTGSPPPDGTLLAEQLAAVDRPASRYLESPEESPEPRLAVLLASRLAERPVAEAERERLLAVAQAAVEKRVAAVVGAKYRGAYERVARLVIACAEALALGTGASDGAAFVAEIRSRYPRHYAFRAELDGATRASPLLPAPPRKR